MASSDQILVVDDDPAMCETMAAHLSLLGYEITAAYSGSQALELIEAEPFVVVILDLVLPDVGGMDVLRYIRDQNVDTEVIAVTSHASAETAIEALRLGAYDYVTKPFRVAPFKATVKKAVEKQLLKVKLDAISDLSRKMSLSLKIEQMAEVVLETIARVLGFEACGLALVDEERGELHQLAAHGLAVEEALRVPLDNEERITVAVARSGESLYVPDLWEDPRYVGVKSATRSELAVPLRGKEDVIGVLNIESSEVDAFTPDDVNLLSKLATQAAIAFENARLYGAVQREIAERKYAEESARQRHNELAALNEISQAINSTLDLQETLTFIASHSIHLMNVEATSVLLYDEDKDDLWFSAASGLGADLVLGKRLAMGQGVAGWVAQHGEPALVTTVSDDTRVYKGFDKEGVFTTHSLLCVPLYSKGKIIGVLEAVNKIARPFDQEDMRLLSALAAPAATAIENARLFEQVRAGRERLRALSRRLVDIQEAERGRVARELHDETGQALSSLLLGLNMLEWEAEDPAKVVTRAAELEKMVDEMLENLHRLSMDLRPASLDHLGLGPAVEHYVELFDRRHDIIAQCEMVGVDAERLPPAVETAIYRIVQEALTNVVRHARASRVDVLLERRGDWMVTIIEDDGVGFDPESAVEGDRLGLFGMRERAVMLGGNMVVESDAGTGTTVLVEMPYVHPDG